MTTLTPAQLARPHDIIEEKYAKTDKPFLDNVGIGPPGNVEPRITSKQLHMMQHCTGHSRRGHRNYFVTAGDVTPEDDAWQELVSLRLADQSHFNTYYCTDAGYRFLYGFGRAPHDHRDLHQ